MQAKQIAALRRDVLMNRDNVEAFLRKHLQNGIDFVIEHRYVARNDGVFLCYR